MMRSIGTVVGLSLGLVFFGASGCSKSSDPPSSASIAGSGGTTATMGGSAGTGGTGGAGAAGKPATGPAITTAPDAWSPPADCGGVGDTCPEGIFGCTSPTSSCQLEGYVCIPAFDAKKGLPGRTAETPYCAAYTCMTFEQASCFCTGEAGKTDSRCASPAALAGLCGSEATSCDADADCCGGFACLPNEYYAGKSCQKTCATHEECGSGCCTDALDTGTKICARASKCETACKKDGEQDCTQNDPNKPTLCCRGSCVQSENPNHAGCRRLCTKNEDCYESGCCTPFSNSTEGFCVDAKFCSCGAAGAACGGDDNPQCCGDTTCLSFNDSPTFTCYQNCTSDGECPSGRCVTLSDGVRKVCGPAASSP
jgi:hypothetical protein